MTENKYHNIPDNDYYAEKCDLFPRGQHTDKRSDKQWLIDMGFKKPDHTVGKWYPAKAKYRAPIRCINTNVEYESIKDASNKLGIDPRRISSQVNGRIKTTNGLRFEKI